MQKLAWIYLSLVLCLMVSTTTNAGAQAMPLSGTVVSASITLTADSVPTTIYSTPAKKGHFVLTQIGVPHNAQNNILFSATGFGDLGIFVYLGTALNPVTFSPGLSIPPGAAIQCQGTTGDACYITGVLEK